ncbi:MAG TPA: hypothetical protein VL172_21630 [Kofleriaceae bacterium]|nr:hypothetical protein [Kofleriaceae bacterium]
MGQNEHEVWVALNDGICLQGCLNVPEYPRAVVVFAQPTSNGRHEAHTQAMAGFLSDAGLATLVVDLLTTQEEANGAGGYGRAYQDVELMAMRLVETCRWLPQLHLTRGLGVGYYGTGVAAAATLIAAGLEPHRIGAVVTRAGRYDLLDDEQLESVWAPTLLLANRGDPRAQQLGRRAMDHLATESHIALLPAAGTLIEESSLLEHVAGITRDWFLRHLAVVELPWGTSASQAGA